MLREVNDGRTARIASRILVTGAVRVNVDGTWVKHYRPILLLCVMIQLVGVLGAGSSIEPPRLDKSSRNVTFHGIRPNDWSQTVYGNASNSANTLGNWGAVSKRAISYPNNRSLEKEGTLERRPSKVRSTANREDCHILAVETRADSE